MKSKKIIRIFIFLILLSLILSFVFEPQEHGLIKDAMKDAVLHEDNKVNFFGFIVNPQFIAAFVVNIIILIFAAFTRFFVIPKFTIVPNKFQMILEEIVGAFRNLANKNNFLGNYIFVAGVYIFIGTLLELLGIQVITTLGNSISLPAPLSDINAAIAMGFLSYFVIMVGGVSSQGIKGIGKTLKNFSIPVSMSFRLFGSLLSGLLVTDLVYHYIHLSFVLPVVVGVLFTLLHAVVQAYVLAMLTTLFYGEVSNTE